MLKYAETVTRRINGKMRTFEQIVKSPACLCLGAGSSARPLVEKFRFAYKSGPSEITEFRFSPSMGDVTISRYCMMSQSCVQRGNLNLSQAFYLFSKEVGSGKARLYVNDVETSYREKGEMQHWTTRAGKPRQGQVKRGESLDDISRLVKIFARWDRHASHRCGLPRQWFEPSLSNTGIKSSFPTVESVTFGGVRGKCHPNNARSSGRLPATACGGAVLPKGEALLASLRATRDRQLAWAGEAIEAGNEANAQQYVALAAETESRISAVELEMLEKRLNSSVVG